MDLLLWYNLLFELPFFAALMYLCLLASGFVTSEHDAGIEIGHDVDVGADGGFDHDVHVEHDLSHDHDYAAEHGQDAGALLGVLSFLGVGKVPISILMMSFCFLWGFTGWASNRILKDISYPEMFVWMSLGVASFSSIFGTRFLAKLLAKIMPATESYGATSRDFVGQRATARFSITESSGTARLRDQYGTLQDLPCRVAVGEAEIPSGSRLILMRYEEQSRIYIARPDPLADNRAIESRPTR